MKSTYKKLIACLLCAVLTAGLSSCSMLRDVKENILKSQEFVEIGTPGEEEALALFNEACEKSVQAMKETDESVRFSVHNAAAESDDENAEVALLNAASKQLTSLILRESPGSAHNKLLTAADTENTLLRAFTAEQMAGLTLDRNHASENVTDERGNVETDENGENVTRTYISDNLLELTFLYYTDTPTGETNEDGEPVTTRQIAEPALIEEIFGEARDRDAVLDAFACLKDYLQISDYTIEYTDCTVKSELDLDAGLLNSVRFVKNLHVTAPVTGVGTLAELGDFRVVFDVTEETDYTFHYIESDTP